MWFKVTFNYTSKYQPMLALSDLVNKDRLEMMKNSNNVRIIGIEEIQEIKKMGHIGRIYTDRESGVYWE